MNRLRNKIAAFMYGRYGVDELYIFLFILYFILFFVNCFLSSAIISGFSWVLILLALLRSMSKNHVKRRRENEKFMELFRPVKTEFILLRDRVKDSRTARYRKCPNCRVTLRLPKRRGKHTVVCPKCRERMKVRIIL